MNGIRKLFLVITMFMFIVTLLLVNLVWTVNNTVTKREVVMGWINDSGFYDNIVDEVAKKAEEKLEEDQNQDPGQGSEDGQKIDTVIMVRAAKKVLTPDSIREKLETVLNGTYDWLEGDTPNLQFSLDLSDEKVAFAESLGDEARARAATLPDCTKDQLAVVQEEDALTVQCKPPEMEALIAKFKEKFATSEDFLADTTITGDDLKSEKDGVEQPITQTITSVPSWYQFAQQLIWFMLLAAVIWGLLVAFLSKNLRYGVKHVAVAFLVASIFVAISAVATSQVTQVVKVSDSSQEIAVALVKQSTKTIVGIEIVVAGVYLALFAAMMLYLYLTKSKTKEVAESSAPAPHQADNAPIPTETDKPKPAENPVKGEAPIKKPEDSAKK